MQQTNQLRAALVVRAYIDALRSLGVPQSRSILISLRCLHVHHDDVLVGGLCTLEWSHDIALPAGVIGTVDSVSTLSGVCRTMGLPNNALLRCVPVIQ